MHHPCECVVPQGRGCVVTSEAEPSGDVAPLNCTLREKNPKKKPRPIVFGFHCRGHRLCPFKAEFANFTCACDRPMKKKGTSAGIPRGHGERPSPVGIGVANNQVSNKINGRLPFLVYHFSGTDPEASSLSLSFWVRYLRRAEATGALNPTMPNTGWC